MKNRKNKIILIIVACFILILMLLGIYFIGYPYYQLSKILDPKTEKIATEYTIERANSIEDLKEVEKKRGIFVLCTQILKIQFIVLMMHIHKSVHRIICFFKKFL